MAADLAIDVENVSVQYVIPHERIPSLKEFAIRWVRGRVVWREFRALTDVTLKARAGESVGVIGPNGAGKTTLLKVIARVLRPATGHVRTAGRVVPLLELGAGFDPELSGRENVFLNGAMLGRSRRDMAARFKGIVDFAELWEFIDAPLRTYSTGMVTRLGFAIATDVEPDVLLLDEVLAVGDVHFQQKCMDRMRQFQGRGVTFLLVSHSLSAVSSLCDRAVWLDHGRVRADGPAEDVVQAFGAQEEAPTPSTVTGVRVPA